MKKGKTSKIIGFESIKVTYGTVDSKNLKSVYLNIQTWANPKIESDNWNRVVANLGRAIKHNVLDVSDTEIFQSNFIVDLGETKNIRKITLHFLCDEKNKIYSETLFQLQKNKPFMPFQEFMAFPLLKLSAGMILNPMILKLVRN